MAAAKFKVSDIAKKMGKSEKDVIFQLQSLGAEITDPNQALEPEVIQALITGKKLTMRTRSVIMREDKPQVAAKKEAVRPPRAIVKPTPRPKREVPADEEPQVAAPPPTVIIPEFVEAVEAEERAAKEAPPPVVAKPRPARRRNAGSRARARRSRSDAAAPPPRRTAPAADGRRRRSRLAVPPVRPVRAPARRRLHVRTTPARRRCPSDLRRRTDRASRWSGHVPARRWAARVPPVRRALVRPWARVPRDRESVPAVRWVRVPPVPAVSAPASAVPAPVPAAPPPPPGTLPGGAMGRSKTRRPDGSEDASPKKKTTGKRGKSERPSEVDSELFTKGPFSGTQIINDDLGPDIPMPETDEDGAPKARRRTAATSRKQAAPVSGKVLELHASDRQDSAERRRDRQRARRQARHQGQ